MKKFLLLNLLLAMLFGAQTAGASVVLNATNFPDPVFRSYISSLTGVSVGGTISDAALASVDDIRVGSMGISSLKGIEYFTRLGILLCFGNQLTSLDVSKNTNLGDLSCFNNQLTALDVSKNTKLGYLSCGENQLTALDVSKNTKLYNLGCSNNELKSLDVSKNTELDELWCDGNLLSSLDVTKNTKLTVLSCSENQLTALDVSKNTELTHMYCSHNQLVSLDLSGTNVSNAIPRPPFVVSSFGGQVSTRRFDRVSVSDDNCLYLCVGRAENRIRNLKIDGEEKDVREIKAYGSQYIQVTDDKKKIPLKVEYEYFTGASNLFYDGWMDVTVNYDVKKYGVYVNNVELTSLNFYDIPGLKSGKAYFYDEPHGIGYNGLQPTLVLNNAHIEGKDGIYNKRGYDFKIHAIGNNIITATKSTCFNSDPAVKTTISGGGTLRFTADGSGIYNAEVATLIITEGTTVISEGDAFGFYDEGGSLYIQENSKLACYGNEYFSVELPADKDRHFDSNIDIRYPIGAYFAKGRYVYYAGTTTNVQKDWVVIGPVEQATEDLIDGVSPIKETEEEATIIYNLAGQRLNKMQKGINIVGGRKVLVK